jgi:predicted  nucleic acid-binding Zn-ribbon protein
LCLRTAQEEVQSATQTIKSLQNDLDLAKKKEKQSGQAVERSFRDTQEKLQQVESQIEDERKSLVAFRREAQEREGTLQVCVDR